MTTTPVSDAPGRCLGRGESVVDQDLRPGHTWFSATSPTAWHASVRHSAQIFDCAKTASVARRRKLATLRLPSVVRHDAPSPHSAGCPQIAELCRPVAQAPQDFIRIKSTRFHCRRTVSFATLPPLWTVSQQIALAATQTHSPPGRSDRAHRRPNLLSFSAKRSLTGCHARVCPRTSRVTRSPRWNGRLADLAYLFRVPMRAAQPVTSGQPAALPQMT